jgi:hypothetical protein
LFFDRWAERVYIYEEFYRHDQHDDENNESQQNFSPAFHGYTSARELRSREELRGGDYMTRT